MGHGHPPNLGAAMRCVPADGGAVHPAAVRDSPALYLGAAAARFLRTNICASIWQEITKTYLSVNGFIIRAVIYFAIWNRLSYFLTKWSAEQDHPPMRDNSARFKALSGPGLILYGFTITFAAIDWVMSIDPSWISTIFGLSFLIGQVLAALCFRRRGRAHSVPLQAHVGAAEA